MRRHFHLVNFSLTKQLAETYISVFLRNFAISLVGIFLPVYLFKELSYSFKEIMFFFIIMYFVSCVVSPIIGKINAKIGCKHTILMSVPFVLGFYILLDVLKNVSFIFYLIPLIGGIGQSMYWIAFHVNFTQSSDQKHRGEEVTIWYVMTIVLGVVGPLIGALILTFLSFNVLFILVAILLLGSAVPLFSSKEIFTEDSFSMKYIFHLNRLKDGFAYMGYGARQLSGMMLWPFFIFFIVKEYFSLGLVISISSIFTALITWVMIGRTVDRHSKRLYIKFGSYLDSFVNFLRLFPTTFLHVLGLTIFGSVAYDLVDVPFSAKTYDKAQIDTLGYMVFRSIFANIGRVLILVVPLVAFYFVDPFFPENALKWHFLGVVLMVQLQRFI